MENVLHHPAAWLIYRQTSTVHHNLMGNKIADHPDVFGAAPTTASFST